MTHGFPSVIFHHTTDLVSPSFDIRLPVIYVYNDTNRDGLFERSEAVYYGYLDAHHNVTWVTTPVDFKNGTISGEYAEFEMSASFSLFNQTSDTEASIPDWANITFRFRITEGPVTYANSYGNYTILGRTEIRQDFTLNILKKINCTGLAFEYLLKGGSSTNMFMIRENSSLPNGQVTNASSRVDETSYGLNFTHKLNQTALPVQEIEFAKQDGLVQAFFRYDSEPLAKADGQYAPVSMNSSYYTTGTGLILHLSFGASNETTSITHVAFLGIDEKGFAGRVRDWLKDNVPLVMVVSGSVVALVSFAIMASMLLKMSREKKTKQQLLEPVESPPSDDRARPK